MQMQQAMQRQMAQQQQQQPNMFQRAQQAIFGQPQQQFQQQGPMNVPRAPMGVGYGQSSSRMQIWGGSREDPRNSILNAPNVFNKQGETTIGVARRQQPQQY